MGKHAHVGARLPEQQKQEWEAAVEEGGYGSVSQLIKLSVENQIHEDSQSSGGAAIDEEALGKVLDRLDELHSGVSRLEEALGELEEGREHSAYDLDRVLIELLPTPPEPVGDSLSERAEAEEERFQFHEWATTANGLANRIGGDSGEIKDRLDSMETRMTEIRSVAGGPNNAQYFFKESDY